MRRGFLTPGGLMEQALNINNLVISQELHSLARVNV